MPGAIHEGVLGNDGSTQLLLRAVSGEIRQCRDAEKSADSPRQKEGHWPEWSLTGIATNANQRLYP